MTKPPKSSKSQPRKAPSASSKGVVPFPYIAIRRGGHVRPALAVIIHTARRRITVRALVDSGADFSIMPTSFARILGVKLTECDSMACETAGGPGIVHVHPIPLEAEVERLGVRLR